MTTRLREWRQIRRVSLRELAKRAGVATSTLHRVEMGRLSPTLKLLEAVGRALHVAVRDLIPKKWPVATRRARTPKGKRRRKLKRV